MDHEQTDGCVKTKKQIYYFLIVGLSQSIRELLVHYRTLTVLSSLIPNLKDQCALEVRCPQFCY